MVTDGVIICKHIISGPHTGSLWEWLLKLLVPFPPVTRMSIPEDSIITMTITKGSRVVVCGHIQRAWADLVVTARPYIPQGLDNLRHINIHLRGHTYAEIFHQLKAAFKLALYIYILFTACISMLLGLHMFLFSDSHCLRSLYLYI